MRLFVALLLPSAALAEALSRAESLRSALPAARWLPPASLHLTLQFLGDTETAMVEPLTTALAGVADRFPRLRLRLAGGGTFPVGRPARVAWVGFEPSDPLLRLQAELVGAISASLDQAVEKRPFRPHLTLARCRRPWPRPASEHWRRGCDGPIGPPFEATAVGLVRSLLGAGGASYLTLARLPLGAGPAAGM